MKSPVYIAMVRRTVDPSTVSGLIEVFSAGMSGG